jgi:hypothetical protein
VGLGRDEVLALMSPTPDYNVSNEAGSFEITTNNELSAAQRLHGSGKLARARMGAATVQRGVCCHEGSIRTEGEVGRRVLFSTSSRALNYYSIPSVAPRKEVAA